MNEEFNFEPNSIEKFRENLAENYKKNKKRFLKISLIGEASTGKSSYLSSLFSQINPTIPNLQKLLQAKSEIRNLKKETQKIDEKLNAFFESLKERKKVRQEDFLDPPRLRAFYFCHHAYDNFYELEDDISKTLLSEILKIQEKNRNLLACITKLEATLQAIILMWLFTSIKQIPSFVVYLICNLNVTIVEWLRSGLGEEMMGDLAERHHELKQKHPNSNVLVSFILLSTVLQMLWSVLLIKLNDLMSDEEINLSVSFSFV